MGLGIKRSFRIIKVQLDLLFSQVLYIFIDLEAVGLFLKKLNKQSAEAVLRKFAAKINQNCDIETGLTIHNARVDFSNLYIGDFCHIGKELFLDLRAPIVINEKSTISMRCVILTHMDIGHSGPFKKKFAQNAMKVEIGPRAYIGAGAIILPGIKIGEGSIIGAGALVNKDVAPWTVVVGVPAREVRKIKDGNAC